MTPATLDFQGHPRLREAAGLVQSGKLGMAGKLLQEILSRRPDDATALFLMAEIAAMQGHDAPALHLFTRSLAASPGLLAARSSRANVLLRTGAGAAALDDARTLRAAEPSNPHYRALEARALESLEDHQGSLEIWRSLAEEYPDAPDSWVRYGQASRALGRSADAVSAFRRAIAAEPSSGEAWWALADLKTFRFEDADVAAMDKQLARRDIEPGDRLRLHFALGKANADRAMYEPSFKHYSLGNALYRATIRHDPALLSAYVARCRQVFTPDFFARRQGFGTPSPAPIFVVGMMRAGSTLVEQILASHSQIEGTRELADLAAVSRRLERRAASEQTTYWQMLERLDSGGAAAQGAAYLAAVESHRRLGKPFFLDKMGANYTHIGLIRMILPEAKVIDVRRHPLACGFSIFSQLFTSGQNDCYSLEDIGRQYHDYVELTAHFDAVLPGRIHRVFYEDLVAEPEREIRRLLDYVGVPFEPQTLEFHTTQRVVATVSAEQVRRPIYKDALEQWRHFEPWLGPLANSLGPVLAAYPAVPEAWRPAGPTP